MNGTLDQLNTTLEELRRAIATADRGAETRVERRRDTLRQERAGQQDLRDALQEVTRAARSLRVLIDYLERHPEALIRGK